MKKVIETKYSFSENEVADALRTWLITSNMADIDDIPVNNDLLIYAMVTKGASGKDKLLSIDLVVQTEIEYADEQAHI